MVFTSIRKHIWSCCLSFYNVAAITACGLDQGLTDFLKGLDSKTSGLIGHTFSIATSQLCHCNTKAARDNT